MPPHASQGTHRHRDTDKWCVNNCTLACSCNRSHGNIQNYGRVYRPLAELHTETPALVMSRDSCGDHVRHRGSIEVHIVSGILRVPGKEC
eukprot:m.1649730 g.1649730  ORF g.1649730 m.1649730 type:complete len:90 (-) comp83739_c0_seq1:162-431(-)